MFLLKLLFSILYLEGKARRNLDHSHDLLLGQQAPKCLSYRLLPPGETTADSWNTVRSGVGLTAGVWWAAPLQQRMAHVGNLGNALALAWPSPGHVTMLGVNQQTGDLSHHCVSSLSLCNYSFQINKK